MVPPSSRCRKNFFDPRCLGGVLYKIVSTISAVNCRRPIRANRYEITMKIKINISLRRG